MKNFFFIVVTSFVLAGCVAVGNQTLKVENKILAPKIISINKNSGPWMGEIERRLQKAGFRVIYSTIRGQRTEIDSKSEFKYNQASTQYFLVIDAAAPTDFARRCFGGGYNFDYIYAHLMDSSSGQTIASIESRGFSEGCPPLNGSIYENITKMVSESWHPKIKNHSGQIMSSSGDLTQEKAIKDFLSGRKLDPIEGIWGSGTSVHFVKKNGDSFDAITINSSTGFTQNGEKSATFKKISDNNYSGEGTFFEQKGSNTIKTPCKTTIQILDINKYTRSCSKALTTNYRLWPDNFQQHNSSIKN